MTQSRSRATRALVEHVSGIDSADQLMPLIYEKLKVLAHRYLRSERGYQTLETSALVNEAYLRMIDVTRIDWRGKSHFLAMAARQMRRILIERARAAGAQKRGGNPTRVTLREGDGPRGELSLELMSLDQCLSRLAEESPRQARVVELRLFAGMNIREIAHILGVSERTIKQDWSVARAWLASELNSTDRPEA
jgi:RNA polymerase sigma factor (TIGR02999 family)